MATLDHLTFTDFGELGKRYRMQQEQLDRRTARICTTIQNSGNMLFNVQVDKKHRIKKAVTEQDFMTKEPPRHRKPQKTEDMIKMAEVITAALGGEDRRQKP